MPFYARYPATIAITAQVETVQGSGTAGAQAGGVLTVQGDPAGTPVPISGNITASSAAVGPTGAPVPADADYVGYNVGGNLTGATGTVNGLNVVVNAPLPAGTNSIGTVVNGAGTALIGKVGIDQTTPGTTNGVQINAALPVGANVIGKVSIDQTTPGTTNGVQVNAALPAGTNKIGAISTVDTVTAVTTVSTVTAVTTVGTVSAVTAITNALPVGANVIGKVSIDQTTPGTTNAVAITSSVQPTTTTAAFQAEGAIAGASITASYVTLFTPSAATKIIQMRNNTDQAISVSFDAGTTTNYTLDSGDAVSLDLFTNGLVMSVTAIQIKYATTLPASGFFRINGGH